MHSKEESIALLKQFDIGNKYPDVPALPKASVLIPLFVRNGELCTLMTVRSKEVTIMTAILNAHLYELPTVD